MKRIVLGVIPVALFGFLAAFILYYTVSVYPPHRYSLDFRGASWITTGRPSPQGYFVKEILVPFEIGDAWIQVAATDSIVVFANGRRVGSDMFVSANVSGIHDLTSRLHPGRNIIGIYVERSTYPGEARLLAKGAYTDFSGNEVSFATDLTWVASSLEEVQGLADIVWNAEGFDHSRWLAARLAQTDASTSFVYASSTSPSLLGEPIRASWLWHPDPRIKAAYFTKSLIVTSPVKDAILGISASSSYDLSINGIPVAKGAIYNKTLHIYGLGSLFRPGVNTIGISVTSLDSSPGLLVEGLIDQGNSVIRLQSDATWNVLGHLSPQTPNPRTQPSATTNAILLAKYPAAPWGVLPKVIIDTDLPISFRIQRLLRFALFSAIVLPCVFCIWIGTALLLSGLKNHNFSDALLMDSLFHIPASLVPLFFLLLKFDVRGDPSAPFTYTTLLVSILTLFLFRILALLPIPLIRTGANPPLTRNLTLSRLLTLLLLASLLGAGFQLRIHNVDLASLSHDEISLVQYTQGLLETGVPSKQIGSIRKPLTTYELVPYSILMPGLLFGLDDLGARLHSVFWGTLEIFLLYILGATLFNRASGILAAAIYAFHPWCIIWAQNAFYPQITQALITLTVLLFYKAVNATPLRAKYLYAAALSFSLMYLTWEGSGFFLLPMALALLVHRASDLSWLTNRHLWASFAIVFLTVFAQMSRRILYQYPYLAVGGGISDIGLPTLFFLDPMYDPYFYFNAFFLMENNFSLTLVLVAGLFLITTDRPLRYLYILLLGTVFVLTNFLQVASTRYVYHMEPLLILIASATILVYGNRLKSICSHPNLAVRLAKLSSAAAASFLLLLSSNALFLHLYLLSATPYSPLTLTRQNVYWCDYKSVGQYVKQHIRQDDLIFSMMPHTLQHYAGVTNGYGLMTLLAKTMVYDKVDLSYGFMDKYVGDPIVTTFDEFILLLGRYNRIWIVGAPASLVSAQNDTQTLDYINRNFRVVYEGYGTRVYLWEK